MMKTQTLAKANKKKKIGGKIFSLHKQYSFMGDAKKRAKKMRKEGWNIRFFRLRNGYYVLYKRRK